MSPSPRGVFVTGTDTGIGKTVVACALVRRLRERGGDIGVMKPIETGVGDDGPRDAIALSEANGHCDPLEDICPQRFRLPAAPTVAAEAEGRAVDLAAIRAAFARLASRHELVIVEGAGGLLVPAAADATMADLAESLELPLLIVARASLGTINHTLLTLEAAASRGLTIAGVVISHADGELSAAHGANLDALRRGLDDRLIGEIPPLLHGELPAAHAVNVDALLGSLGVPAL